MEGLLKKIKDSVQFLKMFIDNLSLWDFSPLQIFIEFFLKVLGLQSDFILWVSLYKEAPIENSINKFTPQFFFFLVCFVTVTCLELKFFFKTAVVYSAETLPLL